MPTPSSEPAPFTIAERKPRIWLIDDVMDNDGSLRHGLRMAFFCSSADVLADVGSDLTRWYARCLFSKIVTRLAIAGVMLALSLPLLGLSIRWALLAVPLFIALAMNGVLAFMAAAVLAAFDGQSWWLPLVLAAGATAYRRQVEPQREVVLSLGSWRPITLLPWRESLQLALRRRRSQLPTPWIWQSLAFPSARWPTSRQPVTPSTPGRRPVMLCWRWSRVWSPSKRATTAERSGSLTAPKHSPDAERRPPARGSLSEKLLCWRTSEMRTRLDA